MEFNELYDEWIDAINQTPLTSSRLDDYNGANVRCAIAKKHRLFRLLRFITRKLLILLGIPNNLTFVFVLYPWICYSRC